MEMTAIYCFVYDWVGSDIIRKAKKKKYYQKKTKRLGILISVVLWIVGGAASPL
jgi:hypothetical protein